MSDASELVVVGAFSQVHEAQLACSVLRAAGLDAAVADENTVAADWLLSNAIGGVKVLVRAEDVATARDVLENPGSVAETVDSSQPVDAEDAEEDVCPFCGSRAFVSVTSGKRINALLWMIAGIPLFPIRRHRRCADCGQRNP